MFSKGDKIESKSTGAQGTIIDTCFNSIYQEIEYVVKWDHHPTPGSYPEGDVHGEWILVERVVQLPVGINFIPVEISIDNVKTASCDHELVEYTGLFESYRFCKKCNKKESEL